MTKKKEKLDELPRLTQELHRVRQQSLAASRNGDFRTVARLTGETARLNRLILAAEGSSVPSLIHLGDMLFTSDNAEANIFRDTPEPALELAESA